MSLLLVLVKFRNLHTICERNCFVAVAGWATVLLMILIVAQVILTNFTNLSVIAFELHLYAAMFLGGVAYAHVINSQVRVDLLASRIRAVPDTLSNCSVC